MWRVSSRSNQLLSSSSFSSSFSSEPRLFTCPSYSISSLLKKRDHCSNFPGSAFFSHLLYSSSASRIQPGLLPSALAVSTKRGLGITRFCSSAAASVGTTPSSSSSLAQQAVSAFSHYGQCYLELSKARLSILVVATSGAGFILGSGQAIDFAGLCWTCVGTMMVAASANSLNQVFEIRNDAIMKRTMHRPLPSGRISLTHAVTWASSVGIAGTALLACEANLLAAGLAASNLILYAFVYTPLKQIHPVNTWVGAIVGAIPPLLGWAAASNQIMPNAMILPAALYFWQIPHFMALAYMCRHDYAAGGYKMYTLLDPSGRRTALVALRNCLYLIPLGYLAYEWGLTSGWFCFESSLLTLAISATALSFYYDRSTKNARRMFHASLLYLPVFMSGLVFHRLSDNWQKNIESKTEEVTNTSTSSSWSFIQDDEQLITENRHKKHQETRTPPRPPPVAFASVAPFPFLPAPNYGTW